ncbi:FMN reductase (NADPH) [Terribacillus saccharophilus]|uniref:FMN reductase (NADPH) n=1 Tax=Terribacillus saccharophilus TaxID=361277 RepID=A0A268HCD4_9BACI|nr:MULTISPECIES: NADPH-dependent FMN reductase [Terribacillus]PAD37243.1 FMN reductase (NADPH) [Terribacillus saccharophilus]PAD97339.1 FMN reductase (NADPH) [Terribacillus saccharophilus]PAE01387.1 FMN reductase (NADPH) [Terribacillus saccharophilus]PAE07528.1 FMN reductase (NADPH) [Terribacillus saccharophilus]VVM32731.1 FMN reductase (EC 1.5.1.29) [Terribacillus sp. AE2B 122]
MTDIIILTGSPSKHSRSQLAANYAGKLAEAQGYSVKEISVTDFAAEDLIYARFDSPAIVEAGQTVSSAKGLIIASPVYKAAYTGVLKALLDLLPQDAFKNKPVLPIMTGGSPAHLLAIDYALKPLIANLKGEPLQGVYLCDHHINKENPNQPVADEETGVRINRQANQLVESIRRNHAASAVK